MLKIMIVDDDIGIIEVIKTYLKDYDVTGFTSSREALNALEKDKYDFLILDYYVDDLNGSEVVKKIREFDKNIYILLLTGYADSVPGMSSLRDMDIQSYVEKTEMSEVIIHIQSAIKSVIFVKERLKNDNHTFATRLRELRKRFNVSQEELGNYLGVGRTTIANYERDFNLPSVEVLEKIGKYFGVSIDYLLCHTVKYPDLWNSR